MYFFSGIERLRAALTHPKIILNSSIVASLLFLAGCGGGDTQVISPSPSPGAPGRGIGGALADGCSSRPPQVDQPGWGSNCGCPVQPIRKWTVLLYMNGANDLERYGMLNLNQLEQFGSDSNVTFVAQFKRAHLTDPRDDDTSDGDWAGTRRYVVRKDSNTTHVSSPIISTRASVDMGDPQTLKDFIRWGVQTFPAEHYAIVLWNHGAGWRSRAADLPTGRGFSYDDEMGTHIDTIQLPDALDMGNGKKWDLIIWDSSLMQMLEVAYEIRNKANYIVGSEESPPGAGYPYDIWGPVLTDNPNIGSVALGNAICDSMLTAYGPNQEVTQSMLDTSKIDAVATATNDFGAALLAAQGTYGNQIVQARQISESYKYRNNKDLYDFTSLVKASVPDAAVQRTAANVQSAIQAAVLKNVHGNLYPNSKGIAIYIPSPGGYLSDDILQANGTGQRYSALSLSKNYPNWQAFLTQGPR